MSQLADANAYTDFRSTVYTLSAPVRGEAQRRFKEGENVQAAGRDTLFRAGEAERGLMQAGGSADDDHDAASRAHRDVRGGGGGGGGGRGGREREQQRGGSGRGEDGGGKGGGRQRWAGVGVAGGDVS
eukprot:3876710-Rhodomonas_salina.1